MITYDIIKAIISRKSDNDERKEETGLTKSKSSQTITTHRLSDSKASKRTAFLFFVAARRLTGNL